MPVPGAFAWSEMTQSTSPAGYTLHSVSLTGMGDAVVASIGGQVDFGNAADLRRRLWKIMTADPAGGLVLELGSVESMDTAAVAVLVEVLMAGRRRGIQVFLCGSSPAVHRLFQLSGLDEALECCCDSPAEVQQRLAGQVTT